LLTHYLVAGTIRGRCHQGGTLKRTVVKLREEEAASASANAQLLRPNFEGLREGSLDDDRRECKVILISEGPGNSKDKNYYSREAIEAAANEGTFEGLRAYLNHQTDEESYDRPEGDIKNLCGYYKETRQVEVDGGRAAIEAKLCFDGSEAGAQAYAKAKSAVGYRELFPESDEPYAGLSINGAGVREGEVDVDGELYAKIVGFADMESVDVVTRPARGGAFVSLVESVAGSNSPTWRKDIMKVKDIVKSLRESRAKLAEEKDASKKKALEAEIKKQEANLLKAVEADPGAMPDVTADQRPAPAEADPKGSEEEPAAEMDLDALKALVPQEANESEQEYDDRMKKVGALMSRGSEAAPEPEDGKAAESKSLADFKKKAPGVYSKMREAIKKEVGARADDLKDTKSKLTEANVELKIMKDRELATKKLNESNVPPRILAADDLIGKSGEEMDREIERTKALMNGSDEIGGGLARVGESQGSDDDVSTMLRESGVAEKTKEEGEAE